MAHGFQHVPNDRREPHEVEVHGLWNVYLLGIVIVILTGVLSGAAYIVWRLLTASAN